MRSHADMLRCMSWVDAKKAMRRCLRRKAVSTEPEWKAGERAQWLEFAVASGIAEIQGQTEELFRIRDRAVTFVAFIGASVAFLVGAGLGIKPKPLGFFVLSGVGTVGLVLLALFLYLGVSARRSFRNVIRSNAMVRLMDGKLKDGQGHTMESLEQARRHLASVTIVKMSEANEMALKPVRKWYNALLWTGLLTLVVWSSLIWAFAS